LRNYTNFDSLRVLGLDGADTFNVTTLGHRPPPPPRKARRPKIRMPVWLT
jgi:hypothetical protein